MGPTEDGADQSIVIPAEGTPSAIACLRSLGSSGIHTIVVCDGAAASAFHSVYCDEGYVVPDPEGDLLGYRDALLALARRPDVRTIVPTREADAYLLSRYMDAFSPHVSLVVPPFESLATVHDRLALARAADAAGVPFPETLALSAVDDWAGERIVKSRYNVLTDAYVDSLAPSDAIEVTAKEHVRPGDEPDPNALRARLGHDPIVQEYVRGDEYMVGALYDHGELVAAIQHHQIRGTSYTGAGGVYRESIADANLARVSRRLLDHLEWHGLACLEYVRDERTGEFKLAEINPRMWQSLAANAKMGADFPRYYWHQATDRTDQIDPAYDVGVGCHWLKGELLHFSSLSRKDSSLVERPGRLATIKDIATSMARQPHFDLLSLDDPAPFVQDWLALFRAVTGIRQVALPGGRPTQFDGASQGDPRRETGESRPRVPPTDT